MFTNKSWTKRQRSCRMNIRVPVGWTWGSRRRRNLQIVHPLTTYRYTFYDRKDPTNRLNVSVSSIGCLLIYTSFCIFDGSSPVPDLIPTLFVNQDTWRNLCLHSVPNSLRASSSLGDFPRRSRMNITKGEVTWCVVLSWSGDSPGGEMARPLLSGSVRTPLSSVRV